MSWSLTLATGLCLAVLGCGDKSTDPIQADGGRAAGADTTFTLPGGATMEFVWIPPGTFTMGSPASEEGRHDNEGPQHKVTLREGFWLGKYEVTQGQWQAVMGTTPWSGQDYVQADARCPAAYISWDDVRGLVQLLNQTAGASVYGLPTEAQWEYACRAGTTTRWSFGDDESLLGQYAWYRDNALEVGERYAHAVGQKLANAWGLFDMHGSVWEWCADWDGSYTGASQTDPRGPAKGSYRVGRGGGSSDHARNTRSADRGGATPVFRSSGLGCRLARTP